MPLLKSHPQDPWGLPGSSKLGGGGGREGGKSPAHFPQHVQGVGDTAQPDRAWGLSGSSKHVGLEKDFPLCLLRWRIPGWNSSRAEVSVLVWEFGWWGEGMVRAFSHAA